MRLQTAAGVVVSGWLALFAWAADEAVNLVPNGSFECWSHHSTERLADMLKSGPTFESEDPLIPTRWLWRMNQQITLLRATDAHAGQYAIAVKAVPGGSGHLGMGRVEVVPGARYAFGVWAKGSGQLTVQLVGEAPEGEQELGKVSAAATSEWTRIGGTVEIPGHIRLVWLRLWPGAPAELLLDDAEIAAPLDEPFQADDVLTKKPERDAHTLLLLDFEQEETALKLEGKAQLTTPDGGRFGRGLRVDGANMQGVLVTYPFKLPAMPEEGTIEFWLSPDAVPNIHPATWATASMFFQVRGPVHELLSLGAFSDATISANWRIDDDVYGKKNAVRASSEVSAWRLRKGEWHHVAVTWDRSAWRFYFDGVLSGITTQPPLNWWDAPVAITMGSEHKHLGWNGVIDEIRISNIKRYGPFTPKGATPRPLPPPEAPPPEPAKAPAKPKTDFAEERKALLGSIPPTVPGAHETVPDSAGNYIYEATAARPLVEGLNFKIETNTIVQGLTVATVQRTRLLGLPNVGGLYWQLGAIKPGRYWLGLVLETGEGVGRPEAPHIGERLDVYLNGRHVHFTTLSDPVQIAVGHWFAEAQSADAEDLRPGDEIAVVGNYGSRVRVARLVLRTQEPVRGFHRMRINPGQNTFNQDTCLGLCAETEFLPAPGKQLYPCMQDPYYGPEQWVESLDDLKQGPDGKRLARCLLFNPLPVPVEVDYTCVVKGYYLQEVGRDTARLTLAPHATVTREIPFTPTLDDPSYFMTTTIEAVRRPELGWPPYDELAFFPGLRHMVAWTDPYRYRFHRRLGVKQLPTGPRPRLALHGQWEAAFTRDLKPAVPPPAELKFEPVSVPPLWGRFANHKDPKANAVYVRRKFTLSTNDLGRVARVVVDSVSSEGTLYLNGQQIGHIRGYGTPLVGDATAALRAGDNELLLVIRNKLAITNPEYVNPQNPTESTQYMDAPGDCNASLSMHGGVWLELMPLVSAQELKVDTSVRRRTIATRCVLVNASPQAARVKVAATVEDGRQPLFTLGEQELTIAAGATQPLAFSKPWKNPRLWSWRQPNLYVLAVEVRDAATGQTLDLVRARFGFRETWVQGDKLFFNDRPVRLNGVGTAPSISMRCDVTLGRGSFCPDFNDESGDPITLLVSGLVNTPSKYNVASDRFWETTQQNTVVAVKRLWNHPSIIAWDLSNEWYTYAPYTGADMELAGRRFMTLSAVVEQLDPSRWTFFNGDYDIGGRHYVLSAHYMLEAAGRDPRKGYGFNGHSSYFPDSTFLKPFDKELKPGDELVVNVHGQAPYKVGSKLLTDTENQWKVAGYMPLGSCKFMGEDNVLSPSLEACAGPVIWMWKQNFDGHRDLNMAIHSIHEEMAGTITRGQLLQTFIMPDVVHHAYGGRTITRDYSVLNDLFRTATLSFQWRLRAPDGKVVDHGAWRRRMAAGTTQRSVLRVKLPNVTAKTRYTLELRLYSDGQFVCGEDRDIEVWPSFAKATEDQPVIVSNLARRVLLFEPGAETSAVAAHVPMRRSRMRTSGATEEGVPTTASALKALGVPFELVTNLSALAAAPSPAPLLIIGEGALDTNNAAQVAALSPFVEAGGHVLVLAQTVTPSGLPVRTTLEPREWVSQPYIRMGSHPLLADLTSWDLHFWAPDRVSAKGAYSKPLSGAAVTLVDSGDEEGLEWVQAMEIYCGRGLYLLCQMPLISAGNEEPMARELLARAVRYAAGQQGYLAPVQRLRLIGTRGGPLEQKLQQVGVAYDLLPPDANLDTNRPTMLEAGVPLAPAQRSVWRESLLAGATLVVHAARPADAAWLSELAGTPVQITVPRYLQWEGRGARNGFDPLTAGLSHLDLFWKQTVFNANTTENPEFVIEPLQEAAVTASSGRELVFPGALVEIPVGRGRLILDQRRWSTQHERLTKHAARNLSALALGLGVSITPPPPPRPWPANVVYRPIDLTPFANRALADEVAGDGKGGWSDQGPEADLRSFPTGDRVFRGVPFKIGAGPKSIIVLKSSSGSGPSATDTPEEVTIPIGLPVEGLCFLHSSAYTGGRVAVYQIQYADGSSAEILLRARENISDWAERSPGEFPNERGTKSYVAWTGSCPMFAPITVLMMQWVNPRPEVPVKAVRFATADGAAMPILIGLTAALKREAGEVAQDQARAQELFKQAQSAAATEAKQLLKQALTLMPDFTAAHQLLADLCEKGGNEDEILEAYRQWTATNPRTPLPWNRLGQILEKRKDYKGALEAYTQSLKVEWNQPPAIEAKTRLERLLSGQ